MKENKCHSIFFLLFVETKKKIKKMLNSTYQANPRITVCPTFSFLEKENNRMGKNRSQ